MKKTTILKVSLFLIVLVAVSGCRKKPKGLTQIPGSEGNIVAPSGEPAGLIGEGYQGGGSGFNPDQLGGGERLGMGGFPEGSDVKFDDGSLGGGSLPDRDSLAGKTEDRETLASYTVYFDFDRYSIRPSELTKVEAVADFLSSDPSAVVKIEGHCDERGTEEYNRALGERRALSVREVLMRLGVSPERATTESWGEDRPAVEGENEAAFSKNRRGEFVLLRQ